ncbi:hypothetical protein AYO38_02610 [bacterium SCGC AG-212-C10]|nr:hypothetical protein AYO38_02610 [bacterium SCGC AG-212-C10]
MLGRRLTVRDKKFALGILAGKSAAMAYRDAGYTSQHPDVMGSRKLVQGGIRLYLRACASINGFGDEEIAQVVAQSLRDAMDAMKVVQYKGTVVELGPDHMVRLKAIDLWCRIMGVYGSGRRGRAEPQGATIVFEPPAPALDRVAAD